MTREVEKNENLSSEQEKHYVGSAFLELLFTTIKYRWFLFWFVFLITVSVTIVALLLPKYYKSSASVFPNEQTDFLGGVMGSGLSSLVKNFSPSKGLASLTGTDENDKYIAILKSGTVLDSVIKKFDLVKVYEKEGTYYEKTVKELLSNLQIDIQDEGNLTITVFDTDPRRAAKMANYFVELLNHMNSKLSAQSAKANRMFIEKRYLQNLTDINDGEQKMKEFQKRAGVVAVPEQLESTVKQMAQIYANLTEKEIQYNILRNNFNSDQHPLVLNSKFEIDELKKMINQINRGNDDEVKLLLPLKQAPELASEYLKNYRNLEIQYKILEFVTPLYEQSKIEEVRSTPSVVVLDYAAPAERKAKPKISLYTIISFIISLGVGFFIVFTKELINKYKKAYPEKYQYIANSFSIKHK